MTEENKKCIKKKVLAALVVLALVISVISLILDGIIINKLNAKGLMRDPVVISKKYDKGEMMEKALKTEKPIIVWFYTDWCGFCQRFAPTFGDIIKDKQIKKHFAVALINADKPENQELMQKYEVGGFPTVYLINPKTNDRLLIDNQKLFTEDAKKELVKEFMEFVNKPEK